MTKIQDDIGRQVPALMPYGECQRESRKVGLIAGVTGSFLAYYFGQRFLRLSPNAALLSGGVSGVLVGYMFSKQIMKDCLTRNNLVQGSEEHSSTDKTDPPAKTF
ncbi:hypothetical protein H4R33_002763 [Dimargaris cristalligena]|nr:hypothetical protein H4R33_002763 [Dimargaris cristalligena]